MKVLHDDDGRPVSAGDKITFSYGIPPVHVVADVIERDGNLVALTPGHDPAECLLMEIRMHVGGWWKA